MRTKFKAWAEPYILEHPEIMIQMDDIKASCADVVLEIGAGKGQFLIDMATKFPDQTFVGIERNVTCAGITAKKIVESKLPNLKLIWGDAGQLTLLMKDKAIDTIFLNFSDPWPKKRHSKRRLTAPLFLKEYHRILKDDGRVIFKTDNVDLFAFSNEVISESDFNIVSLTDNYDGKDEFDAQTEYELSFREIGTPIHRLILRKK